MRSILSEFEVKAHTKVVYELLNKINDIAASTGAIINSSLLDSYRNAIPKVAQLNRWVPGKKECHHFVRPSKKVERNYL
jgi:hypothetical protein